MKSRNHSRTGGPLLLELPRESFGDLARLLGVGLGRLDLVGVGLRVERGVGDGSSPAVDVVVRDVVCDRNYRQGMSVVRHHRAYRRVVSRWLRLHTDARTASQVNVRGLVVTDSTFSRTVGTDPQSGVDIEPDLDYFYETNITFSKLSRSRWHLGCILPRVLASGLHSSKSASDIVADRALQVPREPG